MSLNKRMDKFIYIVNIIILCILIILCPLCIYVIIKNLCNGIINLGDLLALMLGLYMSIHSIKEIIEIKERNNTDKEEK